MDGNGVSIILPARNEARGLSTLLPNLRLLMPAAEIIVVDDGSNDSTAEICESHGVKRVAHLYSIGNGAAVKTGARTAKSEILIFMDADAQHDPADVPRLLAKLDEGYDMVVGARESDTHAGTHRALGNSVFNWLASWMVHHKVDDLTSGFRAVRADKFRKFIHLLPNGFSYPTTITMSFFRAGFMVGYLPIRAKLRLGTSHLNPMRDGMRFLLIIIRIGTLYSPFKLFLPVSLSFFLVGLSYYAYTYISYSRFSNMSALMLTTAILTFLIGVISEQITALHFKDSEK
jgi:glycosyltransferase involved in cell wall biosynthesis